MPAIPPFLLKKLYVKGSLQDDEGGFTLALKNVIAPATISGFVGLEVDGRAVDAAGITVIAPNGNPRRADDVSAMSPLVFPTGAVVTLRVNDRPLGAGVHQLTIHVVAKEVGPVSIPVSDQAE